MSNLPEFDVTCLDDRKIQYEVVNDGSMISIIFPSWKLPPGYDKSESSLLIRLAPGYPDVPPDMWWFCPPVQRIDGQPINATQAVETYLGRTWQRWSRHFSSGQWCSGIDSLESFLVLIQNELERCRMR